MFPCVLLGLVGNLEAGERVNESARGTLERGKREERPLRLLAFPSSRRPKRTFFFSPIHLPHPLGASAEEKARLVIFIIHV